MVDVHDPIEPSGWTGAPAERSADRPPLRCKCGGWSWWRPRDGGFPWQCWACDAPDYPWDPRRVELANTFRASDGFTIPQDGPA